MNTTIQGTSIRLVKVASTCKNTQTSIGNWIEGTLHSNVALGLGISLAVTRDSGKTTRRTFSTSPVLSMEATDIKTGKCLIRTLHSTWQITAAKPATTRTQAARSMAAVA